MQKIILSPPFSNLINIQGTSRILGSYTVDSRPGLWRNITTLRPSVGGWYNKVGLKNPGIKSFDKPGIVSLAGFSLSDFEYMIEYLAYNPKVEAIEFNISCPNASIVPIDSAVIELTNKYFGPPILKLPHNLEERYLLEFIDMGESILHISNSKPTSRGALSGKSLVETNLKTISNIKDIRSDVTIIGGGGIYDLDTLKRYMHAGADYFSISTVLLNPYKTYKLIKGYNNEFN